MTNIKEPINAPPLKDVQPGTGGGHVSKYTNKGSDKSHSSGGSLVPKECQERYQAEEAHAAF